MIWAKQTEVRIKAQIKKYSAHLGNFNITVCLLTDIRIKCKFVPLKTPLRCAEVVEV
jgi:hypothetical protein